MAEERKQKVNAEAAAPAPGRLMEEGRALRFLFWLYSGRHITSAITSGHTSTMRLRDV